MDVWIKRILIVVVIVVAWKVVMPRFQKADIGSLSSTTKRIGGDNSCVRAAEQASETWGSGLGQFVNPPYDLDAWSSFRGRVDARIDSANSACIGSEASCQAAKNAMRDLRALVSDFDSAIRSGGSLPGDVVQRQEAIDNQITSAGDLVRGGK